MKLTKDLTYAVVGASNDSEKYGNKVFLDLKNSGYKVIPINPKEEKILGEKCYATLTEYNKQVDVMVTVVPPEVTQFVVLEAVTCGVKNVWMQPGSESQEAIDICKENGIECVHNSCIMIEKNR